MEEIPPFRFAIASRLSTIVRMSKRLVILALTLPLFSLIGGNIWAAQLDGLLIESGEREIRVVLDMDQGQPYQIHRSAETGTHVVLPGAKLPEAFQGTGLPPVKSRNGNVTASIQELDEGIHIILSGDNLNQSPFEIRFKGDLESQAALPKPQEAFAMTKQQENNNLRQHPEQKSSLPLRSSRKQPSPALKRHRLSKKSVGSYKTAKTLQTFQTAPRMLSVAESSGKASPKTAAASSSKPTSSKNATGEKISGDSGRSVSSFTKSLDAQRPFSGQKNQEKMARSEEPAGYNLMNQALEVPFYPKKNLTEQQLPNPPVLSSMGNTETQRINPRFRSTEQEKKPFFNPLMKWILVSMALLGGLILLATGLILWVRGRSLKTNFLAEQDLSKADYLNEDPVSIPQSPAPEPQSPKMADAFQDFSDYFEERRPVLEAKEALPEFFEDDPQPSSMQKLQPAARADFQSSGITSNPLSSSQRRQNRTFPEQTGLETPANTKLLQKSIAQSPAKPSLPGNVVTSSPSSVARAVKNGLINSMNPYLAAPFRLEARPVNPLGGPKIRRAKPEQSPFG